MCNGKANNGKAKTSKIVEMISGAIQETLALRRDRISTKPPPVRHCRPHTRRIARTDHPLHRFIRVRTRGSARRYAMQLDFSSPDLPAPEYEHAVHHDEAGFSQVIICGVPLRVRQSEILGGRLWSGGVRLAVEIEKGIALRELGLGQAGATDTELHGKQVLEIGAGCAGLPGLALAIKHKMRVTLTEHPDVVPILLENILAVKAQVSTLFGKGEVQKDVHDAVQAVEVVAFEWNDQAALSKYASETEAFQLVVWADAGYFSDHMSLLRCAVAATSPTGAILAVESLRSESSTRTFRKAFGANGLFAVRVLGNGDHKVDETWTLAMEWQNKHEAVAARQSVVDGKFEKKFRGVLDTTQGERGVKKTVYDAAARKKTPETIPVCWDEDAKNEEYGAKRFWARGFDSSLVPDDA